MKQHITVDQLNELSDRGKGKLREWMCRDMPKDTRYAGDPLNEFFMTIGIMIEFLSGSRLEVSEYVPQPGYREGVVWTVDAARGIKEIKSSEELCDALWQAVKEVLDS